MAFKPRETETFRDAAIIFKNFSGAAKKYNQEGDRNFSLMLGEADAIDMQQQGWNVKPLKRREEDEEQLYHLKVKVSFANKPPRVWLVSNIDPETGIGRSRNILAEGMISILDDLDATKIDLVISPYNWEMGGKTGRTAYLSSLFFTMYEDELEREYADVQQIGAFGGDKLPARELEASLEPGARLAYDFEGEVAEDDER